MSDFITCTNCGERYYRKDEHDCPGSQRDLSERIESLEERFTLLEQELKELKSRL